MLSLAEKVLESVSTSKKSQANQTLASRTTGGISNQSQVPAGSGNGDGDNNDVLTMVAMLQLLLHTTGRCI